MADVALAWYSMADDAVTANRGQVRRWAEELGLPTTRLSRTGTGMFFRRAAEIRIPFQNEGLEWELFAEKTRSTGDYELFTVFGQGEGAKKRRLGEVKLFLARRTAAGMVTGSERLKMLVASTASATEREAVEGWQAMFLHRYEELQGSTPNSTVRAMVRDTIVQWAIPVGPHKAGMYYVYAEDLDRLARLREFIEQAAEGASVSVLPIEAGVVQYQMFADAADEHMETRLDLWHSAMRTSYERKSLDRLANPGTWVERLSDIEKLIGKHETRLGWPLLRSRKRLGEARAELAEIVPTADLQRVIK